MKSTITLKAATDLKAAGKIILSQETHVPDLAFPKMGNAVGRALQAEIAEVNRATLRLLATAARLGSSEPLAAALLGTTNEVIEQFMDAGRNERMLSKTLGFPLVQLRFNDPTIVRQFLQTGAVDAASIMAITRSFPLEVVEGTRSRVS